MHEEKKVVATVKRVAKYPGSSIDFLLPDSKRFYDDECKDRIASVSFPDIEDEINVFRANGWTDDEIAEVYDSLRGNYGRYNIVKEVDLPRPIRVTVTIRKYRFGLEAKAVRP